MKNPSIFAAADRQELLARIARLAPDSKPKWGKMDVGRMCAHCQAPLRVALGDLRLKHGLIGKLFGRMAKRKLLAPEPWKPGLPTAPEFRVAEPREFTRERTALVELVRRLGEGGPAVLTADPHPFFGPLSVEEWDHLQCRHLDHHLRQFGV